MPKFSKTEKQLIELFTKAKNDKTLVKFENGEYFVNLVGKPTCGKGEPKTDIFLELKDKDGLKKEVKISVKQHNADFLENKMGAERAEAIFGDDWITIIQRSTEGIKQAFQSRKLIYAGKDGKTEKGAMTLGWKFEILNKLNGELSGEIQFGDNESLYENSLQEVFKGEKLSPDKKNAKVNGKIIPNSGVAEYILVIEKDDLITCIETILANVKLLEDYIKFDKPKIYFACKALNYRSLATKPKWDGNRPLAVYVDWTIKNHKLSHELIFNKPLISKGNCVGDNLLLQMKNLNVKNTNSLTEHNVEDYSSICHQETQLKC